VPSSPIPALALSLTLTSCLGYAPDGARPGPLPTEARIRCPLPEELLGGGDWRLIAGALGDALIVCEGRRALAVEGFDGLGEALSD
jgi:hypothetical protein